MEEKRRRGQPPKEIKREVVITFRVTQEEADRLRAAAEAAGKRLSDYCRDRLLRGR